MKIIIHAIFNSNSSFLTSCSSDMNINDFSNNKPKFKLEEYFNGKQKHGECFMIDLEIKNPLKLIFSEY